MVALVTTICHHHDLHHNSNWIRPYCLFVLPSDVLDPSSFYYYSQPFSVGAFKPFSVGAFKPFSVGAFKPQFIL